MPGILRFALMSLWPEDRPSLQERTVLGCFDHGLPVFSQDLLFDHNDR